MHSKKGSKKCRWARRRQPHRRHGNRGLQAPPPYPLSTHKLRTILNRFRFEILKNQKIKMKVREEGAFSSGFEMDW